MIDHLSRRQLLGSLMGIPLIGPLIAHTLAVPPTQPLTDPLTQPKADPPIEPIIERLDTISFADHIQVYYMVLVSPLPNPNYRVKYVICRSDVPSMAHPEGLTMVCRVDANHPWGWHTVWQIEYNTNETDRSILHRVLFHTIEECYMPPSGIDWLVLEKQLQKLCPICSKTEGKGHYMLVVPHNGPHNTVI
jgi:hypothetical protein